MHRELYGIIRTILLLILIGIFIFLCHEQTEGYKAAERDTGYTVIQTAAEPEETINPTPCAAEPVSEPEPEIEPEPIPAEPEESWTSLGDFRMTAYCSCESCCGYWATVRPTDENGNPIVYTASGAVAVAGTTIAVDPSIIPYGTEVKINDHIYIAQDTGGAIKGNRIDVYHDTHNAACAFAVQEAEVFIRGE